MADGDVRQHKSERCSMNLLCIFAISSLQALIHWLLRAPRIFDRFVRTDRNWNREGIFEQFRSGLTWMQDAIDLVSFLRASLDIGKEISQADWVKKMFLFISSTSQETGF